MILGVSGGVGCGKSTAAGLFVKRGFLHIDSDALIREQILTQPAVIAAIRAKFGEATVTADGAVNRAHLASLVFTDDGARLWLEELTHPLLFARWRTLLAASPASRWVVEAPLLFEKQLENWFDFIVCVTCARPSNLTRLEQRGLTRALAAQRISKQLPLARKLSCPTLSC